MQQNTRRNPWAWVPSLYFAEGLPYVIVITLSVVMYKQLGLGNAEVAYYTGWFYLPWLIKPLWSPFVDLLRTKRWWIVAMQLLMGVGMAGSLRFETSPLPDGVYPVSLFVNGGAHTVAELEKCCGILSLLPPKDDFIREVSVRERKLSRRVERLEESLRLLAERMNGTPLFKQN